MNAIAITVASIERAALLGPVDVVEVVSMRANSSIVRPIPTPNRKAQIS